MFVATQHNTHTIQPGDVDIDWLNARYQNLSPKERIRKFYNEFDNVLLTSSFGTTAVYLLHHLNELGIQQDVHFIDTTFHFEETLVYKEKLKNLFDLNIIELSPDKLQNEFANLAELWRYNPDKCCEINKKEPLESVKGNYNVWISGLMSWQNSYREQLRVFEEKNGILRFYPIIDVSEETANKYIEINKLPIHPLKPLGYESIGCKHCTIKGEKRRGRWAQQLKTECGLHT